MVSTKNLEKQNVNKEVPLKNIFRTLATRVLLKDRNLVLAQKNWQDYLMLVDLLF